MLAPFNTSIAHHVWDTRYRYRTAGRVHDLTLDDTWRRVARAVASVEPSNGPAWQARFHDLLSGFRFLPGGRILAGAGTERRVTLFNCFVMGAIEDSMEGIFEALKQGAMTLQQGGGVGYDFSTLRPAGEPARGAGTVASGPVSFLHVWDAMCGTLLSTGLRHSAMMATLSCDHPDIEAFIDAKAHQGDLTHFNLSVQITDAFLDAVRGDWEWPLAFPVAGQTADTRSAVRAPSRVWRVVRARKLWDRLQRAAWERGDPGVLFVDTINRENNLAYRERITATNPCGEVPLPPYGACCLGSLNLVHFVRDPFGAGARLDLEALRRAAALAVRFLDDVVDASRYPLAEQEHEARQTRRVGLGIAGLADALILLGAPYGTPRARGLAALAVRTITESAYRSSSALAREKGAFPAFEARRYLESPILRRLSPDLREAIGRDGIRNSHLISIAPTGTISLLADAVSSGLEPLYARRYERLVRGPEGVSRRFELTPWSLRRWRELLGDAEPPAELFVTADEVCPEDQLAMQAALQPWVDNAISKTLQLPEDFAFEAFRYLFSEAHAQGLKGCTAFRPNPVTGSVLHSESNDQSACCALPQEEVS